MKRFLCTPYIILLFACILAYYPILGNELLEYWDDQMMIFHHLGSGLTLDNFRTVLTQFYFGQYAPVNDLFLLGLYSCFDTQAVWFHAASLLIHIANVLLVYVFIKQLLLLSGFKSIGISRIAFITALLVAVHPLNVESVAWMSASKIILYVLFYLLAVLAYLRFVKSNRLVWYLLTLFLFILSFGAKEQAVVFPGCLLLIDYVSGRKFNNQETWLEKLPFFVLSIFFGLATIWSQGATIGSVFSGEAGYPLGQRLVLGSYSFMEYLVKSILPVKLSYLYPFPIQTGEPLSAKLWIYPLLIVLLTVLFWRFWKQKWIFFGMAFFAIHVAVALHIISISRFAIVADRYVYLSLVGICFIIAYLVNKCVEQQHKLKRVVLCVLTVYICCIGTYAHSRTYIWHDTDSLKREMRELIRQRDDSILENHEEKGN